MRNWFNNMVIWFQDGFDKYFVDPFYLEDNRYRKEENMKANIKLVGGKFLLTKNEQIIATYSRERDARRGARRRGLVIA